MITYANRRFYTKDEELFLKETRPTHTLKETARLFNNKFNETRSPESIMRKCHKLGIKPGHVKGWNPWLKGKTIDEIASHYPEGWRDTFGQKPGVKGRNTRYSIGDEVVRNTHGTDYIFIKVAEHPVPAKDQWVPKQRYIYEQHYGPIPKDHLVIFCDGNKKNFDIDNLMAISQYQHLVLMRNGWLDKGVITKVGASYADILKVLKEEA